jgi:hypothetical protein
VRSICISVQGAIVLLPSFKESLDPPEQATVAKDRQMMSNGGTFLLPDQLGADLERVHGYWNGLKRGDNDIPFWTT